MRAQHTILTVVLLALVLVVAGCDSSSSAGQQKPAAAVKDKKPAGTPFAGDAPVKPAPGKTSNVDPSLAPLRIALIPIENPERLVDNVKPTFSYLQEQIGRRISYHVTLNYSAAVEALRSDKADVVFMGPLAYVLAHAQTGAEAVLGEIYVGRAHYYAKIFVRKDSGIKTLADLKGKTIAYVDPISSSGYMYPHAIFQKAGLLQNTDTPAGGFFKRVFFPGGDQQAIQSLFNKHVDAAGVGEFSLDLLSLEARDAVTVIATSVQIPSHCVVLRKGLDKTLVDQFVKAMMTLNKPEHKGLLKQLYGTGGYVKVDHSTYASVEKMAREFGFLK